MSGLQQLSVGLSNFEWVAYDYVLGDFAAKKRGDWLGGIKMVNPGYLLYNRRNTPGGVSFEKYHEFPVQVRFPVAWGELDSFQHVNNVWYYRYFENARCKYFEDVGIWELKKTGIGPVLAETKCKYLQQLEYPDHLVVGARVRSIGRTSFIMDYMIVSDKVGIAATGEGILVMYDFNTSKKINVPVELINAIKKNENR